MGWRNWIEGVHAQRRRRGRAPGFFDARGDDPLEVVGAELCTAEIDIVTGGGIGVRDLDAYLVRDARNLADPNAIVVQSLDARRLAFLDRPLAASYAPAFDLLRADARVRATASRASTSAPWAITLYVDRALLEELRDTADESPI
ncbi:MAG: hypothetical protein J7513_09110 [Solirubrobacteraceae bacterium]|nr:hypothetical protein [Solirubrobacteraceae bacterium]